MENLDNTVYNIAVIFIFQVFDGELLCLYNVVLVQSKHNKVN